MEVGYQVSKIREHKKSLLQEEAFEKVEID